MFRTMVTTSVRKSKFTLAMVAALALLVAVPVAGADPARSPDTGVPAYLQADVAGTTDVAAPSGLTIADYGVNTTDYSRPNFAKPILVPVADMRVDAPIAAPDAAAEPVLAEPGSDFPWAGLLVGLGLAGVACLLGLVVVHGSFPRPLSR